MNQLISSKILKFSAFPPDDRRKMTLPSVLAGRVSPAQSVITAV
jgi:hypothetical protein